MLGLKKLYSEAARLLLLLPTVFALDFGFNQRLPSGRPLVSSSFGIPGNNATFDYVVVGGGTAGLAIATRLSEDNFSVAVIEAGGFYEVENSNLSVVPGYATFFTGTDPANFQPLIDWGISTTVQQDIGNRSFHYARGKTLGGSSARNYFLYQRPTIGSMQKWADEVDDQSWNWEHMLSYFKKPVQYTAPNASSYTNTSNTQDPNAFDPAGGPVQVSFSGAIDPLGTWARRAFIEAGMPQITGLSSGHLLGSAYAPLTVDPTTGYRSSSESSYLQSALNSRVAPTVYTHTLATQILFNGTTAAGVSAMTAGTFGTPSVNFTLSARKEVILSAGAFQSPQLLMVSGIGDCAHLKTVGVECKLHRPGVGRNMWDHPVFGIAHRVDVNTASAGINNATIAKALADLFLKSGKGPLSIFGPGYYGWEKLPPQYRSMLSQESLQALKQFPSDWPEVEWLPIGAYNGYNLNKQKGDPHDGHNYATLSAALVAPVSRGTVKLSSPHMWNLPVVDPAWLTSPTDRQMILQVFRRMRQIWRIFADLGVADSTEAFPGSSVQTDAEVMEWIGESMATVYHASGTCKMGRSNDPMAVVDSNASVIGMSQLRVVDASAFPFLPPGHPQSTVYAFAEKIADEIVNGKKDC